MKWFILHPRSNVHGVLFDDDRETQQAVFLTPRQAKFEAAFKSVREAHG